MQIKKLLIIIATAVVMLLTFYIMAFAEILPTITITETVNNDSTVTVTVSFTPDVSAAGTINIKYNVDKLELISAENGAVKAQILNVNPMNDCIVINYLNAQGNIKGDTETAVIKFKLIGNNFSVDDIISESFELYNINSELIADNTTSKANYVFNTPNLLGEVSEDSTIPQQSDTTSQQSLDVENSQLYQAESENSSSISKEDGKASITSDSELEQFSSFVEKPENLLSESDNSTSVSEVLETSQKSDHNLIVIIVIASIAIMVVVVTIIVIRKQKDSK